MIPLRALTRRALLLGLLSAPLAAQWNPPAGQWGKVDPADLRLLTYNVQDGICSSNAKVEGQNNWCALARVVAAFRPDVLLLQECGDNTGNGTGSGVDSTATLASVIGMFLHGGTDAFNGNTPITAWVQKYAPAYDLPHVFVSSESDGFNRNVILSRFPFADLNGDGKSTISDIPNVTATGYAPGGDGGIRGFAFAEIALPDATYAGDLVVGNAHLKAGGAGGDHTQRITAAQNVAYVIHHWFNGNGGGTPDPAGRIADAPAATSVLGPATPVLLGGDWNEDEGSNGTRGPADWLTQAQFLGGTSDGTDRDGTDMAFDMALNAFTGSDASHSSGNKYDYVGWQDSIAVLRHATIFISGSTPGAAQPPEVQGFTGGTSSVTSTASDHRPVFADLRLPVVDCNQNGVADTTDILLGTSFDGNANQVPDECETSGQPICFGDGILPGQTACPCNNWGDQGHGCANSVDPAGALLASTGGTNPDGIVLHASQMPAVVSCIYLQGDVLDLTGVVFGDGVRCADGNLIRLRTKQNVAGASHYPEPGDPTVSVRGMVTPGSGAVRWYQTYYRNSAAAFCPPATFNVTNGWQLVW